MKHFINLKDIPAADLRKIVNDAKKRKKLRKKLSTLEVDKDAPLKGKLLIQMFEKSSLRTRLSFYLAIKQLGGGGFGHGTDQFLVIGAQIGAGQNSLNWSRLWFGRQSPGNSHTTFKKRRLEPTKM